MRIITIVLWTGFIGEPTIDFYRYRPPLQPAASKWSVDLPETEEAIQEELHKQEALLFHLHQELSSHNHSAVSNFAEKEDRVWEVQRNVTQLKRKVSPTIQLIFCLGVASAKCPASSRSGSM